METSCNVYCKKKYFQIGSSMVEVLVSLFILAMGLLAILTLQINALNSVQRSIFISEAQLLATNMADHILSHGLPPNDVLNGKFIADTTTNNYKMVDCSVACNEAQQIQHIHAKWQSALQARLPEGVGMVAWDTERLIYTITIMWRQEKSGFNNCSGVSATDIACFVIELRPWG